jgi:hypothetical protein
LAGLADFVVLVALNAFFEAFFLAAGAVLDFALLTGVAAVFLAGFAILTGALSGLAGFLSIFGALLRTASTGGVSLERCTIVKRT